jgi:hypothetical protein
MNAQDGPPCFVPLQYRLWPLGSVPAPYWWPERYLPNLDPRKEFRSQRFSIPRRWGTSTRSSEPSWIGLLRYAFDIQTDGVGANTKQRETCFHAATGRADRMAVVASDDWATGSPAGPVDRAALRTASGQTVAGGDEHDDKSACLAELAATNAQSYLSRSPCRQPRQQETLVRLHDTRWHIPRPTVPPRPVELIAVSGSHATG